MKSLSKIMLIIFVLILFFAGIVFTNGLEDSSSEHEFIWTGTQPADSDRIEASIDQQISPYPGIEYDSITLSASKENDKLHIHATASSYDSIYTDRYDFIYRNSELTRVGYILEAIPVSIRSEAIAIAMQDEEVMQSLGSGNNVNTAPSVKQILPDTSENFYTGKTLISVTWLDNSISALIDMDSREVVQVWTGQ
ncbi:hypothetical protein [Methanolobus vulcani]|uniref:Uncharacterized protein n=1 Tax=Methanolobus vulcani TaxID=38026 RepID=A0A7Z8P5J8_9EURY|nr:hypothetical protein [Methanolobus vulcani]TQD29225.1 hypothetical protein FKV42_00275 [Methanolobus vulcani]